MIELNVITIDTNISKEESKKKNVFSIFHAESGKKWLLQPQGDDTDFQEWIDAIAGAARENNSEQEFILGEAILFLIILATQQIMEANKKDINDSNHSLSLQERYSKKLGTFFRGRKKKSENNDQVLIFGGLLITHCTSLEGAFIFSPILKRLLDIVSARGMESVGIYRLSGHTGTIQRIKSELNLGKPVDLESNSIDINVISGLVKCYFRELIEPLFPFEFYNSLIDIVGKA